MTYKHYNICLNEDRKLVIKNKVATREECVAYLYECQKRERSLQEIVKSDNNVLCYISRGDIKSELLLWEVDIYGRNFKYHVDTIDWDFRVTYIRLDNPTDIESLFNELIKLLNLDYGYVTTPTISYTTSLYYE